LRKLILVVLAWFVVIIPVTYAMFSVNKTDFGNLVLWEEARRNTASEEQCRLVFVQMEIVAHSVPIMTVMVVQMDRTSLVTKIKCP
jgi:hypothetical protein